MKTQKIRNTVGPSQRDRLRMEDPRIEGSGPYWDEVMTKPTTKVIHKWPKHKREDRYAAGIAAVVAKAQANV